MPKHCAACNPNKSNRRRQANLDAKRDPASSQGAPEEPRILPPMLAAQLREKEAREAVPALMAACHAALAGGDTRKALRLAGLDPDAHDVQAIEDEINARYEGLANLDHGDVQWMMTAALASALARMVVSIGAMPVGQLATAAKQIGELLEKLPSIMGQRYGPIHVQWVEGGHGHQPPAA